MEHELINIDEKFYLNQQEFIKIYKKCGAILHAENPCGRKIDYDFYRKNLPIWMIKINLLLNCHEIQLVNDENLYLFQMGSREHAPTCTEFSLVKKNI